ncbi:phenylacetate-CoA oxygenase subunit PaaJ [Ignavibacteria bacterium]|nr:phenylacetate-CoA oxygenase subunit PaaJ [Bacteroidota bacterium]MCZ2132471.1 phenylacetate-CoA oxygenase subunit PaaJ [Bacteroidota bacterium]
MISPEDVWCALHDVKDPEIPTLSIVDMGIITNVKVENGHIKVSMTPTFVGCPAIEVMRKDVELRIAEMNPESVEVEVNLDVPWDTNRITDNGRAALKKFGLAPPPRYDMVLELEVLERAVCPYCNSNNTEMQTPFGPTLCRSMHYCKDCFQAFEQFKPV